MSNKGKSKHVDRKVNNDKYDNMPSELKQLCQWVVWRLEKRKGRDTKIPYSPGSGRPAKSNDPGTWSSYEDAVAASGEYSGIGFMFSASDPYCGIDVDGVVDHELIERIGSYAERSQSGKGCHIIVKAELAEGKGRRKGAYEIYDRRRYFVMTGDVIGQGVICEAQEQVDRFLAERIDSACKSTKAETGGVFNPGDTDLLDRIRRSKSGAKFRQLWDGQWKDEYKSQSEADMALLSILSYWTNGDKGESFRLFWQSELGKRDKWRKRKDYRDNTWAAVCKSSCLAPVVQPPESRLKPIESMAGNVRRLADFKNPGNDDPNELLRYRYLCLTNGGLLIGPSGVGKSSFTIQGAIMWSLGRSFFGISPSGKLDIMFLQAENDEGDIAEMRDGMFDSMIRRGIIGKKDAEEAANRIRVCRESGSTGERFIARLRGMLDKHSSVNLVIIDPVFAYLGGDALQARDVSEFLREQLNPVLLQYNVGALLVHHSNKPPKGRDRDGWVAGDYSYLGAGSAEWTNWARFVLAIRNVGSDSIFELRAAKRGRRLKWADDEDQPRTVRYIKHSDEGICWVEPDPKEVYEVMRRSGKKKSNNGFDIEKEVEIAREAARSKVWMKGELKEHIMKTQQMGESNCRKVMKQLQKDDGIGSERASNSKGPVYLIGPKKAVDAEVQRYKQEESK